MTLMTCYYGANRFEGKFIGIASDTESFKSADPARLMPGTSFTFHDTCSVPNDKKELAVELTTSKFQPADPSTVYTPFTFTFTFTDLAGEEILPSAYMASKAAVNRFSEALAGEVYAAGLRVFAISPGMVKTDMTAAAFQDLWDSPDVWTPIGMAIDLIQDLDSGLLDGLSGRYLRAAVDDWRALAERVDEVIAKDTHAMRLTPL